MGAKRYVVEVQRQRFDIWEPIYYTDSLDGAKRYAAAMLESPEIGATRAVDQSTGETVADTSNDPVILSGRRSAWEGDWRHQALGAGSAMAPCYPTGRAHRRSFWSCGCSCSARCLCSAGQRVSPRPLGGANALRSIPCRYEVE